ncbi:metal ABC transporter ATP-binding protein [Stackebrandtia nassauensis]|uniref:ABC transporter related protein n=1 Tax=Stackebrandtia nassauensis (strain DSM 44728 / CIP 108903 / NRRL B-16338 / NBRC 102104 / LLR-40K-21) TaxID=446470 RepID=D3Q0K7_STANL|nr:ABC transporter related protein [Stackebrandtia nassauensis DSM 44728]
MSMNIVEVDKAVVGYADRRVLHGVDVTVQPGQAVALLGANGSGKSTLVRTALGLVPLSAGKVTLFGTPLKAFKQWRRIGYVPQRLGAGGGVPATVGEVVAAGRLARRRIPWPANATDRRVVAEAIEAVGLSDRVKDSVSTLSGGQQQRVLIARALATEPELLVMDEPTSGVDAANTELLAELLGQRLDAGAAILLVAHELGPLAPLIDRAVVLGGGRVVHDGPVPANGDTAGEHCETPVHQNLWSVA